MTRLPVRQGVTLLELLLVMALLALLLALSGLAVGYADAPGSSDELTEAASRARHAAVADRRPTSVHVLTPDGPTVLTAFPDGRVLAEPRFGIDPLTGRMNGDP